MKIEGFVDGIKRDLEIYKMQSSLAGMRSIFIYNEDRTQEHTEFKPEHIIALQSFMGENIVKCFAIGYQNEKDQIVLLEKTTEFEF